MKKLAIVSSHPIQYNAPLFKLLADRGKIDIKVIYTWGESVLKDKYDPGFGKVIQWDIPLLNGYNYQFVKNTSPKAGSHHFSGITNPSLNREIEQWGADAVLVFGWSFKSHLKCIRYFHNKMPVFFRGDSTLLDKKKSGIKSVFKNLFLKWVYGHVDMALYAGQNNKAYFKAYGLKDHQLVFAPHAIENQRFEKSISTDFRKQLGISDNETVFLFAGKLESKKNPELLIQAFKLINKIRKDCHLVIVGDGILKDKLVELSKSSNNNSPDQRINIFFLPFQNQSLMPDVYKMADVFVLPSQGPGETWGLSVNEAMASGRAVLVSNQCGCMSDLVEEDKTGYSFESGNLNDLVAKMKLLLDKALTQKMGLNAKVFIKDWSFEKIAIAVESLVIAK